MKKIIMLISIVLFLSCQKDKTIVYSGQQWGVIQINDSIYILTPELNAGKNLNPIVININKL